MKKYVLVNENGLFVADRFMQFELENKNGFKTLIKRPCLTKCWLYAKEFNTKLGACLYYAYILGDVLGRLKIRELSEYKKELWCNDRIELLENSLSHSDNLYRSTREELLDAEEHIDNLELQLREQYQIVDKQDKEIERLKKKIVDLSKTKKTKKD